MNKMTMNKKAQIWRYLVGGIIALAVIIIVIIIFSRGGEQASGGLSDKIAGVKDDDNDGVANMFDQCKDSPQNEDVDSGGCTKSQRKSLG